jgi:hypothetical protein
LKEIEPYIREVIHKAEKLDRGEIIICEKDSSSPRREGRQGSATVLSELKEDTVGSVTMINDAMLRVFMG